MVIFDAGPAPAAVAEVAQLADVAAVSDDVPQPAERQVRFDKQSPFQRVFVVDEPADDTGPGMRVLRFDDVAGNDQSTIDLKNPQRVVYEYVRLAGLSTRLAQQPEKALVIGLGGGAFPQLLVRQHPKLIVDVVEIDPVVVEAARTWFYLPKTPRLQVHVDDGAHFVARARAGYDIVLLDAFSGTGIPPALASAAFFHDARRVLSDRGVVVMNVALVSPEETATITATFAAAFPGCVVVTGVAEDNTVLFGARTAIDKDALRIAALTSSTFLPYDAHKDVESIKPCTPKRRAASAR